MVRKLPALRPLICRSSGTANGYEYIVVAFDHPLPVPAFGVPPTGVVILPQFEARRFVVNVVIWVASKF